MYNISKIWGNLFWFGLAIAASNFDEVQKISKFKIFLGKILLWYKLRIPPKKFWILKFFGLRQNLTRQLQAKIKKGYSKFWICHTFKNFLNCGTNSTFKKRWADNVLNFFFISHSTHFWHGKSIPLWEYDLCTDTSASLHIHSGCQGFPKYINN